MRIKFGLFFWRLILLLAIIVTVPETSRAVVETTVRNEIDLGLKLLESDNIYQIRQYLTLFPYSPFGNQLKRRINRLTLKQKKQTQKQGLESLTSKPAISDDMPVPESPPKATEQSDPPKPESMKPTPPPIEPPPIEESPPAPPKATEQATTDNKESAPEKLTEDSESTTPTPEKDYRNDWSKIEIGIPLSISITDDDGSEVDTADTNAAIILAWSDEVMMGFGGGAGIDYFTRKIQSTGDELQHLYFEGLVRGTIVNLVNVGAGFGYGITSINLKDAGETKIVPGQGTITTFSVGLAWRSYGLNYSVGTFNGSYRWANSSGGQLSEGEVKWKGTMQFITFEYVY
jgi:hypothetical protein